MELGTDYATAHEWYAWHLSLMGRNNDALTEMGKALDLDPVSPIVNSDFAELLLIAHRPDQSIRQSRKTISLNPGFVFAHNQLAQAYIEKGMFGDAITESQQAIHRFSSSTSHAHTLALTVNRKRSSFWIG